MTATLDDAAFLTAIQPLVEAIAAAGFAPDSQATHATWQRLSALCCPTSGERCAERVVLWRHPRRPNELQAYVSTGYENLAIHLRFFDPSWRPDTILPGYLDKGWPFASAAALSEVTQDLAATLWPRALAWFAQPIPAEAVLRNAHPPLRS